MNIYIAQPRKLSRDRAQRFPLARLGIATAQPFGHGDEVSLAVSASHSPSTPRGNGAHIAGLFAAPVRYYAEVPVKDETTEAWLKGNAAYLSTSTKPAGEA